MTLAEQADGSVVITPGAAIGFDGSADGGGKFDLVHEGLVITAHEGEGGALVYDYSADSLKATIDASFEGYSFDPNTPAQRVTSLIDASFEGLRQLFRHARHQPRFRPGAERDQVRL